MDPGTAHLETYPRPHPRLHIDGKTRFKLRTNDRSYFIFWIAIHIFILKLLSSCFFFFFFLIIKITVWSKIQIVIYLKFNNNFNWHIIKCVFKEYINKSICNIFLIFFICIAKMFSGWCNMVSHINTMENVTSICKNFFFFFIFKIERKKKRKVN